MVSSAICTFCGGPLLTPQAKQCFTCGMDWHDPDAPVKRGPGQRPWRKWVEAISVIVFCPWILFLSMQMVPGRQFFPIEISPAIFYVIVAFLGAVSFLLFGLGLTRKASRFGTTGIVVWFLGGAIAGVATGLITVFTLEQTAGLPSWLEFPLVIMTSVVPAMITLCALTFLLADFSRHANKAST